MFQLVRPDIALVGEGVMVLLEALSVVFVAIVIYICRFGNPLHSGVADLTRRQLTLEVLGFLLLVVLTCALPHYLVHHQLLLMAWIAFAAGIGISSFYYFAILRDHLRPDDNTIPYTMMVWGGLTVLSFIALLFLWLAQERIQFEAKSTISLDVLAQVAGIVVSAAGIVFTYVMKSEQSNKTANHKIYQTLELQSVDLFRFECDHRDLVEALWYSDPPPKPETPEAKVEEYRVKQYICQMLNLFEMAYRFRVQGIMAEDVFGSWVIWMFGLCASPVFRHYWLDKTGLPENYVADFRRLMHKGVDLFATQPAGAEPDEDRLCNEFFAITARQINCKVVKEWLVTTPRRRYGRKAAAVAQAD